MVWTKGGAPVDTSRVHVHTSDFDTVFFVRQAARSDSGEYELSVQIENMKDTATIHIRVVGAPPAGAGGGAVAPEQGRGCEVGRGRKGGAVGAGKGPKGTRIREPGEAAEVGRDGEKR